MRLSRVGRLLAGVVALTVVAGACSVLEADDEAATSSSTTVDETVPPATTGTVAPTGVTTEALCGRYGPPTVAGALADPALDEVSGLVASRTQNVLWAHNDSGNARRIVALAPDGTTVGTYDIDARGFDWEDIALGPAPDAEGDHLYLGDIGDNLLVRSRITIERFAEPDLDTAADPEVTTLRLVYPDGPHDAEALLFDPVTLDLFVITKETPTRLYRVRWITMATAAPGDDLPMELVATLPDVGLVTAADISADGLLIAFRGYGEIWLWSRDQVDLGAVVTTPPCRAPAADEVQGEAIAVTEGRALVTVSEGTGAAVNRIAPS